MKVPTISANEAFKRFALRQSSSDFSHAIDVRSQSEYEKGHLPGSKCIPILSDEHRHQVGSSYKQFGSNTAFALAEELVSPIRQQLIEKWSCQLSQCNTQRPGLILCWRGGSRSRFAVQWLLAEGLEVVQVEKGFKALRHCSLNQFETYQNLVVIGGMTGSGKSQLLKYFKNQSIDLEFLANHRGSAFGGFMNQCQPSQVTFEFALAFELYRASEERLIKNENLLVEDESLNIGKVRLPKSLYQKMAQSPSVLVEATVEERTENIYNEYILKCSQSQINLSDIQDNALTSIYKIKDKLGGKEFSNIVCAIKDAFSKSLLDQQAHMDWISQLLRIYYDPRYLFSLSKKNRTIIFQGSLGSCKEWLSAQKT